MTKPRSTRPALVSLADLAPRRGLLGGAGRRVFGATAVPSDTTDTTRPAPNPRPSTNSPTRGSRPKRQD